MLQVISAKQFHLMGPSQHDFSAVAPSLWNILLSQVWPIPVGLSEDPGSLVLSAILGIP